MKPLPLFILTLAIAVTSFASDKVIYNFSGKATYSGDGYEHSLKIHGQTIWEPATNQINGVFTAAVGTYKAVFTSSMTGQQFFVFKGAAGKEYNSIVIAEPDTGTGFETDMIKGRRYSVNIGNTLFSVPKIMTETDKSTTPADSGEMVLCEENGTYVLDTKASATSNALGETLDTATARLKQSYLARGYSDGDK
jgi:hypothetical protein